MNKNNQEIKSNDPKGTILIIGGSEEKLIENGNSEIYNNKQYKKLEILEKFLKGLNTSLPVEVITSASGIPSEIGEDYVKTFRELGHKKVNTLNITDRNEANSKECASRIDKAAAVFFTGGDQFRITTIFECTKTLSKISSRYNGDKNFRVGGTSAGAMALSKFVLYRAEQDNALLKGDIKMVSGLGLIDHCIIDTHFIKRPRFGRLIHAILINQDCTGIGLGENTALYIEQGNIMECYGSGMVTIIDGSKISYSNVADIKEFEPINVQNLVVHILKKGDKYLLREREFIAGPEKKNSLPEEQSVN